MYKRVKKYNLNTSDKAHGRLLLKNLFTSLLLSGKITTTEKKAKSLKQFAEKTVAYYRSQKLGPIAKKTWLQEHLLTRKLYKQALEVLERVKDKFAIRIRRAKFRKGDGAILWEVSIINFDEKKDVQQN